MTEEPKWFQLYQEAGPEILAAAHHVVDATDALSPHLATQRRLAFYFLVESGEAAYSANLKGSHAVAVGLLRQSLEALSVLELGVVAEPWAAEALAKWSKGELKAGNIRQLLSQKAWGRYGNGLWGEPYAEFFANLTKAVQDYAHYSNVLSQWQMNMHPATTSHSLRETGHALMSIGLYANDPQKATRVTFYSGLFHFAVGRVLSENGHADHALSTAIREFGNALAASPLLDGPGTNWGTVFWSFLVFGQPYSSTAV